MQRPLSMPWSLRLWRGATFLGGPLIKAIMRLRVRRGKEDATRIQERYGIPSEMRPNGPVLWIHAVSVGESLAALTLIRALQKNEGVPASTTFLLTTGTVSSTELVLKRIAGDARIIHQYAPWDRGPWIARFLDYWQPVAAIRVESEFWPEVLVQLAQRNIPILQVNACLSPRSRKLWPKFAPSILRFVLSHLTLCLAQSDADAEIFKAFGAPQVGRMDNLKYATEPLAVDAANLETFQTAIKGRPVWLAASTHGGEEIIVLDAHRRLQAIFPDILTIIAPRHPARGAEILALAAAQGIAATRRSIGALPGGEHGVYIADTLGEMGLFYRAAPIVLVGGSLVPIGGHNVLEPAHLHCAIMTGPHMEKSREVESFLNAHHGLMSPVANGVALAEAVTHCLKNPDETAAWGARAFAAVQSRQKNLSTAVGVLVQAIFKPETHE